VTRPCPFSFPGLFNASRRKGRPRTEIEVEERFAREPDRSDCCHREYLLHGFTSLRKKVVRRRVSIRYRVPRTWNWVGRCYVATHWQRGRKRSILNCSTERFRVVSTKVSTLPSEYARVITVIKREISDRERGGGEREKTTYLVRMYHQINN